MHHALEAAPTVAVGTPRTAPWFRATSAIALAASLLACGGDDDDDGDTAKDGGTDAATTPDAATVIPTFNGCTPASYEDRTSSGATRTVAIQGSNTFLPKCMIIAVGQTVTWAGSLSSHPLAKGNKADGAAGSPNNPIVSTSSGSSVAFTFPAPGTYPYHCAVHDVGAGTGMAGVIHVR